MPFTYGGYTGTPANANLDALPQLPGVLGALPAATVAALSAFSVTPVVASAAARNALFTAPVAGNRCYRLDSGYYERYTGAAWVAEGFTRGGGPVVGSASKGAVRDGATDDSAALTALSAAIAGGTGVGEIDVNATGAHLIANSVTVAGHISPLRGAMLKVAAAKNIHFTGTIDRATPYAWLDLSAAGSSVTIDQNEFADLRWFGPHADGATADEPQFNNLTLALPQGAKALLPKGNYALANPWLVSGKKSHIYDSEAFPMNANLGDPLTQLTWTGAAHGTMVQVFSSQFCKFGGLLIQPGTADIVFDIDKNIGQIGTQCTFERINIFDNVPNKPGFVGFRMSNTVGSNQEYHHFIRNSIQGGQNGQVSVGGHDLSQGMCAVTNGSNVITFDAAWLALGYWVNSVTKRRIHIVGPAGQQFETRVAYASATTGTMDAVAPWTNATAQFAFNRNPNPSDQSANDTNPLNGVDVVAGSPTVTFDADFISLGFWGAGVVARRMRIARGAASVVVANFVPSGAVSATVLNNNNIAQVVNQWAPTPGHPGFFIHTVSGTGAGQIREIVSNDQNSVTWGTPLSPAPDVTTHFEILVPVTLDTTISYASATTGTLAVAPTFSFAGQYFIIGEGMGIAIGTAPSFNAKRQISQDNSIACMATGISQAGGSLHSTDDNFTVDGEVCVAIGGAISEPCYIIGSNTESWRSVLNNNTFVPVGHFFSRMAQDRIAPSGSMYTYGASATDQILIGNSIDTGPLPRGTRVHDLSQAPGVRIISIGNEFPFSDVELGYKTFRANQATDTAYIISLGEPSSSPQFNWAIQVLSGNRQPGGPQYAVANRIDGFLRRGIFPVDPTTAILDFSTTVEYRDTTQDIIYERTEDDKGNFGTIARPTSNATRTGVGAGQWNLDKTSMGKLHRCDGTVIGGVGLPNATTLSSDWWADFERIDNGSTTNSLNLNVAGGGLVNGMANVNLVGQWTKIRIRARGDGTNNYDGELLYLGQVKVAWNVPNIVSGTSSKQDFTIKGAQTGCRCFIEFSVDVQGMVKSANVKVGTADTVTGVLANLTGGAINLGNINAYLSMHPFAQP